jgi:hypothetical protein
MSTNLDVKEVYALLKKKGVQNLFHANTVRTSLTFIHEGALLSRGYVEQNSLAQTDQYTDDKDKKLGIWDSVFLDGYDLHKAFDINLYGPVLFVINLDILLDSNFKTIKATKSNPSNWSTECRFHDNIQEIDDRYLIEGKFNKAADSNIMFILDSPGKRISLDKYCDKIVLDDPRVITLKNEAIYDLVKKTLGDALSEAALDRIAIEKRHTDDRIHYCQQRYRTMAMYSIERFNKLFSKDAKLTS